MSQPDSVATLPSPSSGMAALEGRPISTTRVRVLGGSLVMLTSMVLVNLFNFGYNVVMARKLGPEAFGHINAAVTLLLIASCVSLAFQLVCAKFVARAETAGSKAAVVHALLGKAWIVSLALAVLLFIAQRPVANYLNLPSPWIIGVLALGIAAYAPVGVKRGAMQGECSFPRLGGNFVLEAGTRFVVGVVLVAIGYGVLGAVGAISVSVIIAYFFPRLPIALRGPATLSVAPSFAEALQAIVFFVGQVIINNIDILLVKHFFPAGPAGVYAAIAQIGRLLYFICWFGVVNAMFPVTAAAKEDHKKADAVGLPMLMVFGICLVFVVLVGLFPQLIMGMVFGSKFASIGPLLALYAAATGLYSLSVVLIAYEMSRRIANTGWLQLLFSAALVVAIGFYHGTLREVIMVRVVLLLAMLIAVSVPFFRRSHPTEVVAA